MKASKLLTKKQRNIEWGRYIYLKKKGYLHSSISFEDFLTYEYKLNIN